MCVNSVLSASDLAWMETALDTYGLLQHAVSLDLCCIDADFAGALQKVCCHWPASTRACVESVSQCLPHSIHAQHACSTVDAEGAHLLCKVSAQKCSSRNESCKGLVVSFTVLFYMTACAVQG